MVPTLEQRRDELDSKIAECDSHVDDIENRGARHQSKSGIDAPWVDSTASMLRSYKATKSMLQDLVDDLNHRIEAGEV